jgi:hypothetical protein
MKTKRKPKCSYQYCQNISRNLSGGLCGKHYMREYRTKKFGRPYLEINPKITGVVHPKYPISLDEFNRRYWDSGESMESIAHDLDGWGAELRRYVLLAGLKIKSKRQAYDDRMKYVHATRKYFFDYEFFNSWSPEMAWVLGLIASDGCIHKGFHYWQITMSDIDCLEQVAKLIKYDGPINLAPHANCYILKVNNTFMVRQLTKIGLTPRKSLTLKYPEMPDDMNRHFIRGYFDGDGNFSTQKTRSKNWDFYHGRVTFTSGSENFINKLSDILFHNNININQSSKKQSKRKFPDRKNVSECSEIYYARTNGISAVRLYHFMYRNLSSIIYLSRKYSKYKAWYEKYGHKYETNDVPYSNIAVSKKCHYCKKPARSRGLCIAHYAKFLKANGGKAPKR